MSQNFPQSPYGNPSSPYQNPPSGKLGMSAGAIVGIVVGVVLLLTVVCAGVAFMFVRGMSVDSTELVTKRTSDGVASLEVPKNWTPISGADANPEASLQVGNPFAETYAMVLSEAKSDFAGIDGEHPDQDGSFSLEDYADLIISMMTAPGSGMTSTPKQLVSHNGMPAYRFDLKGSVEGNQVVFIGMLVDGDRHFHQVLCWTLASRETKNMSTLNMVLDSFKET